MPTNMASGYYRFLSDRHHSKATSRFGACVFDCQPSVASHLLLLAGRYAEHSKPFFRDVCGRPGRRSHRAVCDEGAAFNLSATSSQRRTQVVAVLILPFPNQGLAVLLARSRLAWRPLSPPDALVVRPTRVGQESFAAPLKFARPRPITLT